METRKGCIAALLLAGMVLAFRPSRAWADQPRSVGYVLSFRLGIDMETAGKLVEGLAHATQDWQGQPSRHGEAVAKSCASSKPCIQAAAKSLGVSRLGVVTVVAAGGVVRVDVRLMDANTGREILRTHVEYESGADATKARRALFDLIPRLLPGEKAVPIVKPTDVPPEKETPPRVPPVSEIPEEMPSQELDMQMSPKPAASGPRWWLWGGIGAAATAAIVTGAILMTRDDSPSGPTLELPPPP